VKEDRNETMHRRYSELKWEVEWEMVGSSFLGILMSNLCAQIVAPVDEI
jgi:hypothetical protein